MRDTPDFSENPNDEELVLIKTGEGYFLLEGEDHLGAMLACDAPYPTPVHCIECDSDVDMDLFLERHDVQLGSLWGINPAIIARLIRNGELVMINPPSAT